MRDAGDDWRREREAGVLPRDHPEEDEGGESDGDRSGDATERHVLPIVHPDEVPREPRECDDDQCEDNGAHCTSFRSSPWRDGVSQPYFHYTTYAIKSQYILEIYAKSCYNGIQLKYKRLEKENFRQWHNQKSRVAHAKQGFAVATSSSSLLAV